jgi:hypothetical protein
VISSRHYDRGFCRHGMVDSGTQNQKCENDSGLSRCLVPLGHFYRSYAFGRIGSCTLYTPPPACTFRPADVNRTLGHVLAAVIRC